MIITTVNACNKAYTNSQIAKTKEVVNSLPLARSISKVDMYVLSTKDFGGFSGKKFLDAVNNANNTVVVLYTNEKSLPKGLDPRVIKLKVSSFAKVNEIKDAIDGILETEISKKELNFESKNEFEEVKTEPNVEEVKQPVPEDMPEENEQPQEQQQQPQDTEQHMVLPEQQPVSEENPEEEHKETLEEKIARIAYYGDMQAYRQLLRRDTIHMELIQQSSEYQMLYNMLDVMDKEIVSVARDESLSSTEKFDLIRTKALTRIGYQEKVNMQLVEKVNMVIAAVLSSADFFTKKKVQNIKDSLLQIETSSLYNKESNNIDTLIRERLDIIVDIQESLAGVLSLYHLVEELKIDVVENFDKDLPTSNEYVKSLLGFDNSLTSTHNAGQLATELAKQVSTGRIQLSAIEVQLSELIENVYRLCEKDNTIIKAQQRMIAALQSQKVEDVVIVDTVLKACLHVFTGPDLVGLRSTAIMWAGVRTRQDNTMLIDITGNDKFENYGVEAMELSDLLVSKVQRPLLYVKGKVESPSELRDVISELKTRLSYYRNIAIIVSTEQQALLDELSSDALVCNFITDTTSRSLAMTKQLIENFKHENIAKKLIAVRPSISALDVVREVGADPLTTKVLIIPNLPRIQYFENKKLIPYNDEELRDTYEAAFNG